MCVTQKKRTETETTETLCYKLVMKTTFFYEAFTLNSELLFEHEVVEESMHLEEEVLASGESGREGNLHRVVNSAWSRSETAVDTFGEDDVTRTRVWTWCWILNEDFTCG